MFTQNLIFFILVLCIMNKGQNRVGEVEGSCQQYQISHDQTDLENLYFYSMVPVKTNISYHSLWCGCCEIVRCLISVPIMQCCSSNAQPQKNADDIHDGIRKFAFVFCGSKEIREELNRGVNQITYEDSRSYNLSIRRFFLVQVPCTTNTQEVTAISKSIQNKNDDVQNLDKGEAEIVGISHHPYKCRPRALYQPHLVLWTAVSNEKNDASFFFE